MSEKIPSKKRHGRARVEYRAVQQEVTEKLAAGYSNIMIYEELAASGRLTVSYSAFCDYVRGEGNRSHSRRHRRSQTHPFKSWRDRPKVDNVKKVPFSIDTSKTLEYLA